MKTVMTLTCVKVVGFVSVSTIVGLNIECLWVMVVVFNAIFNNVSAISWRSGLLVEENGENHRPATSH